MATVAARAALARVGSAQRQRAPVLSARAPMALGRTRVPPSSRHMVCSATDGLAGPAKPSVREPEKQAEEKASEPAPKELDGLKLESWGQIMEALKEGKTFTCLLTRFNGSGFTAKAYGINGFIPYSLMDPAKLPWKADPEAAEKKKAMLGTYITVKVAEAEMTSERLIFSEIAGNTDKVLKTLKVGEVRDGVVRNITDFGAFVSIMESDGKTHGTQGLVHKSEMSWDVVTVTSKVVQPGQAVKVKVIGIDTEKNQISLSMKQCQEDPSMANLDTLLPAEEDTSVVWQESSTPFPGLEQICQALRAEDDVLLVTPGRQAEVPRVVSQDLQIFMTKEQVSDGYNLVARSGTRVQEVRVATDLSRDQMKKVLTKVLQQISK